MRSQMYLGYGGEIMHLDRSAIRRPKGVVDRRKTLQP